MTAPVFYLGRHSMKPVAGSSPKVVEGLRESGVALRTLRAKELLFGGA